MEVPFAVVRPNCRDSFIREITNIIDIRHTDDGTAMLVTNTAGKTFRIMCGDAQPITTMGWKKSCQAPFWATHPQYLDLGGDK